MTAALPLSVSTLFEMKSTIALRQRKPALIVFSLAILLLIPTATTTVMPATLEPLNPDATLSPSATSTDPNNTNYPDNKDNPNNSQNYNPDMENTFNLSTAWIGLAAGIAVVVIVSLAIVFMKRSKKQKNP